ncbi:uncharacterized protein MAM_04236 [Metarhizium album ARSEF 1941]|uniref:Uncharacterized protein n=1 Tax=Metarhizium album (strain ARSEF 1941) TaxID=1081103 RepID=A0A0B2WWP9_METAS|nr:uncharacterized protein MAM_04236 [Metarhizium album ARSEF 1941]KHN97847.1 hypothetical protein MAM_04236 [Metarhizium album ARSEF 1941]
MEKRTPPTLDAANHEDPPQILTPPPYSSPSSPGTEGRQLESIPTEALKGIPRYPGLPKLDYELYSPPLFKLSSDSITLSSKAEYLSSNAAALVSMIRAQSTVPPKPQIHVRGSRGRRVDFDIKLNLMNLLVPDDERLRMDYIRCVGEGELAHRGGVRPDILPEVGDGGLEEWCRRFVQDTATVKTFSLDRVVANLDVNWIEGQLRSLIATLKYRGAVDVTFLVTHSRVLVQSPDRVNQFFTNVTSLFSGKNKYEVIKSVWPFATTKNGEPGRRCIVQSEKEWWREWRDPIRYAIAQRRQGWVTVEDKLEAVMEGKGKQTESVDWGPDQYGAY